MTPADQLRAAKALEPNYAAERKLPEGMTCANCQHGARCEGLFGAVRRGFTSCDFWPSRFRCVYCDGTGDVHRPDGEWLGECGPCARAISLASTGGQDRG